MRPEDFGELANFSTSLPTEKLQSPYEMAYEIRKSLPPIPSRIITKRRVLDALQNRRWDSVTNRAALQFIIADALKITVRAFAETGESMKESEVVFNAVKNLYNAHRYAGYGYDEAMDSTQRVLNCVINELAEITGQNKDLDKMTENICKNIEAEFRNPSIRAR